ncbi:MAG: SURF1 family protein [Anaerolineales bacterium]|nr:SURF1 family protein [Anaerolineales bacterium]
MRTRDWLLVVLLAIVGLICIRLGFWQLARRQERIAKNEEIQIRLSMPPSDLTEDVQSVLDYEFRRVEIEGIYVNEHSVVLRNRSHNEQTGVHLITPLQIEGHEPAILIDRGWISNEAYISQGIDQFEVDGSVVVQGVIRLSQEEPSLSFLADPTSVPGAPPRIEWRVLNIERIQSQIPTTLYPFFIELSEHENISPEMPIPDPEIDLGQGPHLSYAIQWFGFSVIALVGGVLWVRRHQPGKE